MTTRQKTSVRNLRQSPKRKTIANKPSATTAHGVICVIQSRDKALHCTMLDEATLKPLKSGFVANIGKKNASVTFEAGGKPIAKNITSHADALHTLLVQWLEDDHQLLKRIKRVGHKITHGGEEFTKPTVFDKNVFQYLWKYKDHAPFSNPGNLLGVEAAVGLLADIPHVAVFDTMLFSSLPSFQYLYALPYDFYEKYGIRRYAFQGLAHEAALDAFSVKTRLPWKKHNVISCVLSEPSSVAAFAKGEPIDATMYFSPLGEQAVVSRFAETDPMVILAIIQDLGMDARQLAELLQARAGVSSRDASFNVANVTKLLKGKNNERKKKERAAREALDMYVFDVQRNMAAGAGLLGQVDAVVFSGNITQENPMLPELICRGVPGSLRAKHSVVEAFEEVTIARYTRDLL